MKLIKWSIHHPTFANLMMLLLLFSGMTAIQNLHRELFPVFAEDKIQISVEYSNAQAEEVEEGVCIKIEEALVNISEIKTIKSTAQYGMGIVNCTLLSGKDPYRVFDKINTNISGISFPKDTQAPKVEILLDKKILMKFFLYGDVPNRSLQKIAQNIKEELLNFPGIDAVYWRGHQEEQVSIEVSERALLQYNIDFSTITTAIERSSLNSSAGVQTSEIAERNIYIKNRLYSAKDYAILPVVKCEDGTQIFLHNIATVKDAYQDASYPYYINGKSAIRFHILSPEYYDSIKLAQAMRKYIHDKQESLPHAVKFVLWEDYTQVISGTLDILWDNAIAGMILVVICLAIFLDLRLSFWVALGIPISFCGGFLVMWLLGKSLNLLSLFALVMATGIVVDDAIIVGENIQTAQEQEKSGKVGAERGVMEMVVPVFTAVATTIITFTPLFFLPGMIGNWIREIPVAVIAVLVFSFFESMFILPAHLAHKRHYKPNCIRRALNSTIYFITYKIYAPLYRKSLQNSLIVVVILLCLAVLCIGLLQGKHVEFITFPQIDSENVYATAIFPPGTSTTIVKKSALYLESLKKQLCKHFNDDRLVVRSYCATNENLGIASFQLNSGDKRRYTSNQVLNAWNEFAGQIPGAYSVEFNSDNVTPGGTGIEIQLFSTNLQSLIAATNQLKLELAQFNGVYGVGDDSPPGKYTLTAQLKPEGVFLGIDEEQLAKKLADGFYGAEVLKLQRGREEVKVMVRYEKAVNSLDANAITIEAANGHKIPLSEIVTWSISRSQEKIHRENHRRVLTIHANVAESIVSPQKVIHELQMEIFPNILQNYTDVQYAFGGQYKESKKSSGNLALGFEYALITIFVLLTITFRSYLQPILLILVLPFACLGAILGHWIMGYPLSMMSFFGIVALCGIAVNDSIVFIEEINNGIRSGLSVTDAVYKAGPRRFRAITLTSLTTIFGLLPLLLETSLQAYSIIPMAISMSFGLILVTFITLFLLPILFLYLNTLRRIFAWLCRGKWPTLEEVEPAFRHN